MNIKHLLAATAFTAIGASALAEEGDRTVFLPSTLTRAEVMAELAQARASGELARLNRNYSDFGSASAKAIAASDTVMVRSRDEVRAEAITATRTRVYDSASHS